MKDSNKKLSELYNLLTANGGKVGANVNEFAQKMQDSTTRQKVYDLIKNNGANVGDFNDFSTKLGYSTQVVQPKQQAVAQPKAVAPAATPIQATSEPQKPKTPMVLRPTENKPSVQQTFADMAFKQAPSRFTQPMVTPKMERGEDGSLRAVPTLVPSEKHPALPKQVAIDPITQKQYDWDSTEGQQLVQQAEQIANDRDQSKSLSEGSFNIAERQKEINALMAKRGNELDKASEDNNSFGWNMSQGGGIGSMPKYVRTNNGKYTDSEYRALEGASQSLKDAQARLDEAKKSRADGAGAFVKGVGRGLKDKLFDVRTWDMGATDLRANGTLAVAIDKYEKGEPLSKAEQMLLDAKATQMAVEAYTHSDIGYGYEGGQITAQALPFMLEMMMNPASTAGKSIQSGLARYALKRFAQSGAKRAVQALGTKTAGAVGRIAGDALGSALMAGTTGIGGVTADAIRRTTGEVQYKTNEEGQTVYNGTLNREELSTAIGKAFASRTIENHSEMVGNYFAPITGALGKVLSKGAEKLGLGAVNNFITRIGSSKIAKEVNRFADKTQWNGIAGEFAEEIVGGVENAIFVGDQTLDTDEQTGVFNKDNLLRTAIGVSIMGGFMSAVKTAGYRTERQEANSNLRDAERSAERAFANKEEWQSIRDTMNNGALDEVQAFISNEAYSPEKRKAVAVYAMALGRVQGLQAGVQAQQQPSILSSNARSSYREAQQAYASTLQNNSTLIDHQQVYEAQQEEARLKQELQTALNAEGSENGLFDTDFDTALQAGEELDKHSTDISPEVKALTQEYLNARAKAQGIRDYHEQVVVTGIADHIHKQAEMYADQDGIIVRPAYVRIEAQNADEGTAPDNGERYIYSGNLATREDGSIDVENSDATIVVYNPYTNEREMVSSSDFVNLGDTQDMQTELDKVRQDNSLDTLMAGYQPIPQQEQPQPTPEQQEQVPTQTTEVPAEEEQPAPSVSEAMPTEQVEPSEDSDYDEVRLLELPDGRLVQGSITPDYVAEDGRLEFNYTDPSNPSRVRIEHMSAEEIEARTKHINRIPRNRDTPRAGQVQNDDSKRETHRAKIVNKVMRELRDTDTNDHIARLNLIQILHNNDAVSILSPEDKALYDEVLATAHRAGYEVIDLMGKEHKEGMNVIVEQVDNAPSYEEYSGDEDPIAIIDKVLSPQINKDGKMVQAARVNTRLYAPNTAQEPALVRQGQAIQEEQENEEVDHNGLSFVVAPNGTTTFGEITEETGLTPAPIKLSEGFQTEDGKGYGLAHIEARHGDQIRNAGFNSVEEFVAYVASEYDTIKVGQQYQDGEKSTYLIELTTDKNNTLFVELAPDGDYWHINSAGIFRQGYSKNKDVVWSSQPALENRASVSSSEVSQTSSTDRTESSLSGNSLPTTSSTDKVSNNSVESKWQDLVSQLDGDTQATINVIHSEVADLKKKAKTEEKKIASPTGKDLATKVANTNKAKAELARLTAEIAGWEEVLKWQEAQERAKVRAEQEAERVAQVRQQQAQQGEAQGFVPEWADDKPELARERGYRRYNGEVYHRSEPIDGALGAETEVKFHDEHKPKAHFVLIEASNLLPSHYEGKKNPRHFLEDAQPKNREEAVSTQASRNIAKDINPEEITRGVPAYQGSPVINERGEVLQGNGRSAGLLYMYENYPESVERYKEYLRQHASEFGLTPEQIDAMDSPILVRMLDEVSDDYAVQLGQYTASDIESGGEQHLRPAETMRKLGKDNMQEFVQRLLRASREDADSTIGELIEQNGEEVIRWLLSLNAITPTQVMGMTNSEGKPNTTGKDALRGLLKETLFMDSPSQFREDFELLPDPAQHALLATAYRDVFSPDSERMMTELQDSVRAYAVLYATSEAFKKAKTTEQARQVVRDWETQYEMDWDTGEQYLPNERYKFSNFALELVVTYHKAGRKHLTNIFNDIYSEVQGTEIDMFNPEKGQVKTLAEAIQRVLNITYNKNNGTTRSETLESPNQPSTQGRRGSNQSTDERGSTQTEGGATPTGGSDSPSSELEDTAPQPETNTSSSENDNDSSKGKWQVWYDEFVNSIEAGSIPNERVLKSNIQALKKKIKNLEGGLLMGAVRSDSELEQVNAALTELGNQLNAYQSALGYVQKRIKKATTRVRKPKANNAVKPENNPSGNKLVTDERYAELKERMKKKLLGQMNMGVDPEILTIGIEMATYHLEKGTRKFADYAKAMLTDLGDGIKPYLKAFYNGARDLPEIIELGIDEEMTSYDEVRTFDIANMDKAVPNVLEQATQITEERKVEQQAEQAREKLEEAGTPVTDLFSELIEVDSQGNPINEDGSLKLEGVTSVDELTDEDFTAPSRNILLPMLPANVDTAIGANGKPVIIKKNILEKNARNHKELSPNQSREVLGLALYSPNIVGANQPQTRPNYQVAIHIGNMNSIVVLDVQQAKENIEIVGWRRVDAKGLEKIKRQALREDGQLLILPSEQSEEAGALSSPTQGSSSASKVSENEATSQETDKLKTETTKPTENNEQVQKLPRSTNRTSGRKRQPASTDRALGDSQREVVQQSEGGRVARGSEQDAEPNTLRSRATTDEPASRILSPRNERNNRNPEGKEVAPQTTASRFEANIKAIETLKRLQESNQPASVEDMQVLRQFSGWGGLGTYFDVKDNSPTASRQGNARLRELLTEQEYNDAELSRNSAYFTPVEVIETLWSVAERLGFKGGNILEGSAGIGSILGYMPQAMSQQSDITAVEIDSVTGAILGLLYPDAKVYIQGFQETKIANGSVDLAITNVPFVTGLSVHDEVDTDLSRKFRNIHDFAIAKNVRKLREGGIGIFITSSGTLDKSKELRQWVINNGGGNADFIGAFRLHNETFGGTAATSDIIVIRKRIGTTKSANAIDVQNIASAGSFEYQDPETGKPKQQALYYNAYYQHNPQYMGGRMYFAFQKGETYRPTSKSLYPDGINQSANLIQWVEGFQPEERAEAIARELREQTDVNEGRILIDSKGEIAISRGGEAVSLGLSNGKVNSKYSKQEVVRDYLTLKTAHEALLKYQTEYSIEQDAEDGNLTKHLQTFNEAYDTFVGKYGMLNNNKVISFLREDIDFAGLSSVENIKTVRDAKGQKVYTAEKTDIFTKRILGFTPTPTPTSVKDAVIVSLRNKGDIEPEYIADMLGANVEQVKSEILQSGLGFENPITNTIEARYTYLSGNVREKLEQARANNENGRYDTNIKALESVLPIDVPAHLIVPSLGATWIPSRVYQDFFQDKFGLIITPPQFVSGAWHFYETQYNDGRRYVRGNNEKNKAYRVHSDVTGKSLLGNQLAMLAMKGKAPEFTKSSKDSLGKSITIRDKEADNLAMQKVEEIKEEFKEWFAGRITEDASFAEEMVRIYNDKFNNYQPLKIDKDMYPEDNRFEGMSLNVRLLDHQVEGAMRGQMQPLMLAHEVGSGKTFTMIASAMEMRRMGTARKPMIVVQNSTLEQFVHEAKRLYPNAKILSIGGGQTPEARRAFYGKVKHQDWDLVIVPQSVFNMIPDSPERVEAFISERIEEKERQLEILQEDKQANYHIISQLEADIKRLQTPEKKKDGKREAKTKANTEAKAKGQIARATDEASYFEDMGVDALFIDEAHNYKKLGFETSASRIKGIDTARSTQAGNLYIKVQTIFDMVGWRNVVFATGTPISNTAAELYTWTRYLMPKAMREASGIMHFDEFRKNFGEDTTSLEFTTSGKFKEQTRFASYTNLEELIRLWATISHTQLKSDSPELQAKQPVTELGGSKAEDIFIDQTPELAGVMRYVRQELEAFEKLSGAEKKAQSHIPLNMFGIAQLAAIDVRLVDNNAEYSPNSKTGQAIKQILRSLNDSKDYNGTVAVFSDRFQNKNRIEANGKHFNLFEDIKIRLVAEGVPEEQIVVMNSQMNDKQKQDIFDKVNAGEVRVILGTTPTLGVGVNIQERLHTLIHLDAPNRPMDYEQRNGRILRQGNLHKAWDKPVRILRLGVRDTLDVTAYQRLKIKEGFIRAVMEGSQLLGSGQMARTLDEADEGTFDNPVAQLSGSQFALLKQQAERELRKYKAKHANYVADQKYISQQLPKNEQSIELYRSARVAYSEIQEQIPQLFPNGKIDKFTIEGHAYSEDTLDKAIAEHIKKPMKQASDALRNDSFTTAKELDFKFAINGIEGTINVQIESKMLKQNGSITTTTSSKVTYTIPKLAVVNKPVARADASNAFKDMQETVATGQDISDRLQAVEIETERLERDTELMRGRANKPFEYTTELAEAEERVVEYEQAMAQELAEKEARLAQMQGDTTFTLNTDILDEQEEDSSNTRYRRGEGLVDTDNLDAMASRAEELGAELGVKVRVEYQPERYNDARRTAKGWFDPKTGEVVIVPQNNNSVADVEATIYHEVVGHKGLRELIGDKAFNDFLIKVYNAMPSAIKSRVAMDFATGRVRSLYEAVEEYIAEQAEQGFSRERSLWRKIVDLFRAMVRPIVGSRMQFTDNDIRYMLWRSYNLRKKQGLMEQATDLTMRQRWQVGRFRSSDALAMQQVNDKFNTDLQRYIAGDMKADERLSLGMPHGAMSLFLPNLPIVINQRILNKASQRKHDVELSALYDMPSKLAQPIFVFRKNAQTLAILTEMQDRQGRNVFVAIDVEVSMQSGKHVLSVNSITSIHGRDIDNVIKPIAHNNTLVWVDRRKGLEWLSSASPNVQQELDKQDLVSATKVVKEFVNPKLENGDIRYRSNLAEINDKFNTDLQQQVEGTLPKGHIYKLGMPSEALLAGGIPNLPIELSSERLAHKASSEYRSQHPFELADITNLPNAVANPIAIFNSKTKQGSKVVLTELQDSKGNNFVVALQVRTSEDSRHIEIEINSVRSLYPKDRKTAILGWINDGLMTWVDKRKALNYISTQEPNYLAGGNTTESLNSATKVVKEFVNPKLENGDIRYRQGSTQTPAPQSNKAQELYNYQTRETDSNGKKSKFANLMFHLRTAYQDYMLPARILRDAVLAESGQPLQDFEDFYTAENQMGSRTQGETIVYNRDYLEPLKQAIVAIINDGKGAKYEDIVRYLIAKHGLERNERMSHEKAKRKHKGKYDPNNVEISDHSGLTALTGSEDNFTAEAERMVQDFEAKHDTATLWHTIREANKATLSKALLSGMMSRATYEDWLSMYQHYVPLRGWSETTAEDIWTYQNESIGRNGNVLGKTAKGRTSLADDPIATMAYMAENAIRQGNRNIMKMKLYNFAVNHPTSLLNVKQVWYTQLADGSWMETAPDYKGATDEVTIREIDNEFLEEMKRLEAQGKAKRRRPRGVQIMSAGHLTADKLEQHAVRVRRAGEEYIVYVMGNPMAAQAINGSLNANTNEGELATLIRGVNNYLAKVATSNNPTFIIKNLTMDYIHATASVAVMENADYQKKFQKAIGEGLIGATPRLLSRFNKGTLDFSKEDDVLFDEFIRYGGETGYVAIQSVDDYKKNMERFVRKHTKEGTLVGRATDAGRVVLDGVEYLNRLAELNTRFAIYKASRQSGRSIQQSVDDAKNITVNFNRKGSGKGYLSALFRGAYMFFNASVQAGYQLARMVKAKPKRVAMLFGSTMLLGIAQALLASLFYGDDDDEYWAINEHTRRNNIIVPTGTSGSYVKIPLPHLLRPFFALGDITVATMLGKQTFEEGANSAVIAFSGILPMNPVGGSGGDLLANILPSWLQPWYQANNNINFFGEEIYPDKDYEEHNPDWTKVKDANTLFVEASRWLNEISGGDKYKAGSIDISPDYMEHIVEGYTSGAGQFVNKVFKTLSSLINAEAPEAKSVPFVSTFFGTSPHSRSGQLSPLYWDLHGELKEYERVTNGYAKELENSDKAEREYYWKRLQEAQASPIGQKYIKHHEGWKDLYGRYRAIKEAGDKASPEFIQDFDARQRAFFMQLKQR